MLQLQLQLEPHPLLCVRPALLENIRMIRDKPFAKSVRLGNGRMQLDFRTIYSAQINAPQANFLVKKGLHPMQHVKNALLGNTLEM